MILRSYRNSFIGRAGELARLDETLAAARTGTPAVVVVCGEAGVGKSRLVTEFAQRAAAGGVTVLAGGCVAVSGGGLPYGPVVEALRGTGHDGPGSFFDRAQSELGWLPFFGRDSVVEMSEASSGIGQLRLFEWLLGLFQRICESGPLVLVVEDLHWANQSTRDLLSFMTRNVRDERFMLVATYRDDECTDPEHRGFLAELTRVPLTERIDLNRFDRNELAALLAGVLSRAPTEPLVDRILAQSGGNAFFAEQLVAAGGGERDLPPKLWDILMSRLEVLSEDAQDTLAAMSVCGRRVRHDLLARVSDLGSRALTRALREAVRHQIVSATDGSSYLFRHALMQEAVYQNLLPGERLALHGRVAAALESGAVLPDTTGDGAATAAAEIAHHWFEAREFPRALAAAITSARLMAGMYAFTEAAGLYERALDLWDRLPGDARPAGQSLPELLRHAAEAARWVGHVGQAIALVERALRMLDQADDRAQVAMLHDRLGLYLWEAGEGRRSIDEYRTAEKLLDGTASSPTRAWVLADQARMLMLSSRYREAVTHCHEALAVARRSRAPAAETHVLDTLGFSMVMLGDHDEGIAHLRNALSSAAGQDDVEGTCRACTNLVTVLLLAGRHREALAVAEDGIEMMRRLGVELAAGGVLLSITAGVLFRLGDWRRAETLTQEVLDRSAPPAPALFAHVTRIELNTARGRLAEAARSRDLAEAVGLRTTDPMAMAGLCAATAELEIWSGAYDQAEATVERGLKLLDDTEEEHLVIRLCALGLRAAAEASLGGAASARASGAALIERLRAAAERPSASFPEAVANRLTGEAEYTRLEQRSDPDAWAAAAAGWEELGFAYPAGYARLREADAMLTARHPRSAAAALKTAHAHVATLGGEPTLLGRDVETLARRAHIDLSESDAPVSPAAPSPAAPATNPFRLTPREREVLALLVEGLTNRQIARTLFVSEKTASVHVSNIMSKLQVDSRGRAAAVAYRMGLVDDTP